jgi:mannitol-1-phosphate 5-dehydrogenase
MEMEIVVFGAGNIGRSFVGQLFARAGYRVVFVDVDDELVGALNRDGRYRIEIRDRDPERIWVEGVSAIHGRDLRSIARRLAEADIAATAVGPSALPEVYPAIAGGLMARHEAGRPPLDIIICENLRNAADAFETGLQAHLPPGFPLKTSAGLIETSIGKMVPLVPEDVRSRDPLLLYAEAYNSLILDGKGFKNPIPCVPGLEPKGNMAAYVDRKAFIHNCGHAVCAYIGHLARPRAVHMWEVAADPDVQEIARRAMWESGRALIRRYPDEFDEESQGEHIEDLLSRFANRKLDDTIYRVGRDIPRKLSREDRLIGALLMDAAEGVAAPMTAAAAAAGFLFGAVDEHGAVFPADAEFTAGLAAQGPAWAVSEVCRLDRRAPPTATWRGPRSAGSTISACVHGASSAMRSGTASRCIGARSCRAAVRSPAEARTRSWPPMSIARDDTAPSAKSLTSSCTQPTHRSQHLSGRARWCTAAPLRSSVRAAGALCRSPGQALLTSRRASPPHGPGGQALWKPTQGAMLESLG